MDSQTLTYSAAVALTPPPPPLLLLLTDVHKGALILTKLVQEADKFEGQDK